MVKVGYGFSSIHVWIWELDFKESWALKNWCFWSVVLEKTLDSPLDCREIQPVHPKGNQSWIVIERNDAEAEAPILWPPDVKNRLIGKDLDAGKDWRQEKGTTEDEMVRWYHQLDGHEFDQSPGVGDGQGSLKCCSLWGRKLSGMTEWLNWTELQWTSNQYFGLEVMSEQTIDCRSYPVHLLFVLINKVLCEYSFKWKHVHLLASYLRLLWIYNSRTE